MNDQKIVWDFDWLFINWERKSSIIIIFLAMNLNLIIFNVHLQINLTSSFIIISFNLKLKLTTFLVPTMANSPWKLCWKVSDNNRLQLLKVTFPTQWTFHLSELFPYSYHEPGQLSLNRSKPFTTINPWVYM